MDKANRTVEHLAKTSADSYKTVIDHVVAQQERNVKFAREIFDGTAREIRHQTESNRALGQELIERAEQQRDAFQTLIGESADVYRDLLSTPLSFYRQGPRLVENGANRAAFPIAGYDE